jgi:sugar phosphate isomerase/epimerase
MGEGCIPIRRIRGWAEQAGFAGFIEVEIFSNEYWAMEQGKFVESVRRAYVQHV